MTGGRLRRAVAIGAAILSSAALTTPTVASAADPATPREGERLSIPRIQGAGHVSPYAGQNVSTAGVVTARKFDGYWVQDPRGDGDDETSDAIYVFAGRDGAKPQVGDSVRVEGTVKEYRPGDKDGSNLAVTELTDATATALSEPLPRPEPVTLGSGGRLAPAQTVDAEPTERTDVEATGEFRPDRDAIDFYETMEGMLVQVADAEVIGPTNQYGELTVLPAGSDAPRTTAGGVRYAGYDRPNAQRLTVEDEIVYGEMPAANVGDTLTGEVSGPLDYNFGTYRMYPTEVPTVKSGGLRRDTAEPAGEGELALATFNVENLDPTDPQRTFDRLAKTVVDNLAAPDLLTLEEIQDNTGAECPDTPTEECEPDGVVDADQTLDKLVKAITAAGGPNYEWRQISPENLADGGEPTGNIRNAFLFRTDRGLRFVDRPGGDATTATEVRRVRGRAQLTLSPGRIAPRDPAWKDTRKSLAGEFTFRGRPLIVVANHLSSKGGDDPIMGRWQPPHRGTEEERHPQATVARDFVRSVLRAQPTARVVVAGDINDFQFSDTTSILEDRLGHSPIKRLHALARDLPEEDQYTYNFQGNSQVLDQVLVSPSLYGVPRPSGKSRPSGGAVRGYDTVHVNADFADQVSDHDPQLVRLGLGRG